MVRIGLSATVGNLKDAASFIGGTNRKCSILVDSAISYDIDVKISKESISNVAKFVSEISDWKQDMRISVTIHKY